MAGTRIAFFLMLLAALLLPAADAFAKKRRGRKAPEKASIARPVEPAAVQAAEPYEAPTTFEEPAVPPDLNETAVMPGVKTTAADGAETTATAPASAAPAVTAPANPVAVPTSKPATSVVDASGKVYTPTGDAAVDAAHAECERLFKGRKLVFSYLPPISQGSCGTPQPVEVSAFGEPPVKVTPAATMNCAMLAKLDSWFTEELQGLARKHLQAPIARIENATSYHCRNRYGDPNEKLSEHARANALDMSGFVTSSGLRLSVASDWGPNLRDLTAVARAAEAAKQNKLAEAAEKQAAAETAALAKIKAGEARAVLAKADVNAAGALSAKERKAAKLAVEAAAEAAKEGAALDAKRAIKAELEAGVHKRGRARDKELTAEAARLGVKQPGPTTSRARFLHAAHASACTMFGTVLGPEANAAHRDHFHVDLTPRRNSSYCQ